MTIPITITIEISMRRVLDLVGTALDSASILHWVRRCGEDKDPDDDEEDENDGCHYVTKLPDGFDPNDLDWLDESWSSDVHTDYFGPLVDGGTMTLFVDDDRDDGKDTIVLDLAAIKRGLAEMAKQEPVHFAEFMDENEDSVTADIFMQCCAFGRVVY